MTTRRQFLAIAGSTALGLVAAPRLLSLSATQAQAQAIPGAPSFTGVAGENMIVGPIPLGAGVTVLRAQHNGAANFTASLFVPQAGLDAATANTLAEFDESFLVFDLIGAVKSAGAALVGVAGDHYLAVTASGAWQISVEQPLPENIKPVQQTTFTGKGEDVSPYFTLPANVTSISLQTTSTSLRAWLYHIDDLGGEAVQAGLNILDARIFDQTFPGSQTSYPITLPDAGPYVLAVTADVENKDPWTISFTGAPAQPAAVPGVLTFKGAAGENMIAGPIPLGVGVTVLRAQHNGNGNFTANLFVPQAGLDAATAFSLAEFDESFLVFDLIGAVKSSGVALVGEAGDHFLAVTASGAWQITVEQPLPKTVTTVAQTTFKGKGEDVSPYFTLPANISSISVQTASTSLRAWLYHIDDLGGEAVQAGLDIYDGRIFDQTFPGNEASYPITLPDAGPYLLAVTADVESKDAWTISFA
jgi:hypothetical protein